MLPIDRIFVPQGPEYRAVCQGLNRVAAPKPSVLPIPIGPEPLTRHLAIPRDIDPQAGVLLMGLCGSLTPHHAVGDVVLYRDCIYETNASPKLLLCDLNLTALIHQVLPETVPLRALTSDRLICSAREKQQLAQEYGAEVVDMEGFAILKVLNPAGIAVGMVRVVSDDCRHNLPDLNFALSPDGTLKSLPLAIGLLRQPVMATRLIYDSLQALQVLQQVTTRLFTMANFQSSSSGNPTRTRP